MTYAIHLRADPWDRTSVAFVIPMSEKEAKSKKTDFDKFCDKRYFHEVFREGAKDIITVIQIGEQEARNVSNS